MRLFLFLVVLLARVSFSLSQNCKKLEKQFTKNCLKKGFETKMLENCEVGDGVLNKKAAKKCKKLEKKVIFADCNVKLCAEPADAFWCGHMNSYLNDYAGPSFNNLEDAQKACLRNKKCNGITQVSIFQFKSKLYQISWMSKRIQISRWWT